jgi:hypothetical protein
MTSRRHLRPLQGESRTDVLELAAPVKNLL